MSQTLIQLSQIIATSAKNIEQRCDETGTEFPSLHQPLSEETEAARHDPEVLEHIQTLVSAATQIIAAAKVPQTYIFNATCSVRMPLYVTRMCAVLIKLLQYYLSSALRVATETHVAEILRDAGTEVCVLNPCLLYLAYKSEGHACQ